MAEHIVKEHKYFSYLLHSNLCSKAGKAWDVDNYINIFRAFMHFGGNYVKPQEVGNFADFLGGIGVAVTFIMGTF